MTSRSILVPVLAVLLGLTGCASRPADPVLATVGESRITLSKYREAYQGISAQKPDVSTPEGRQAFLNDIVNKELMQAEAVRRHPDLDDGQRRRLHRYAETQLMNLLTEREINSKISVSDADVEAVWNRMDQEFHVRHILSTTEEKARAILAEIQGGRSFEDAAREKSVDEQTKGAGGDLGWIRPGDMIESFDKVMASLPKGQVSEPFRTRFGWHIVRVDDIRPFERPTLDSVKERVRLVLMQERSLLRQEQFQKELMDRARPENQLPALQLLDSKFYFEVPADQANNPYAALDAHREIPSFTDDELKTVVVKFADRPNFTVQDFNENLSWKPPGIWPSGKGLEEMEGVLKIMVRERLYRDRAIELKLDQDPDYIGKVKKKESEIRVNSLYYFDILNQITPTDAQMREFFDKNHESFKVKERCKVARVETADSSLAAMAARDWRSGKDFTDVSSMVKGLDPAAVISPSSGDIPRGSLPNALEQLIYSSPVGQVFGPLHLSVTESTQDQGVLRWVVVKTLETKPERYMGYEEATEYLPSQTKTWLADLELKKILEEARSRFTVKIDEKTVAAIDPKELEPAAPAAEAK